METIYQLVKIGYKHDNRQDKEERDSSATQLVINEAKEIHSSLNGVKVETVTREACNPLIGEMIERQFTFGEMIEVLAAVHDFITSERETTHDPKDKDYTDFWEKMNEYDAEQLKGKLQEYSLNYTLEQILNF